MSASPPKHFLCWTGVAVLGLVFGAATGCGGARSSHEAGTAAGARPWILLVTMDTTRADAMTPAIAPSFTALAARGRAFTRAYAAVPETLPSHTAIMTGLYPAAHGIHENGRALPDGTPLLAARLKEAGYRTSAFVSSFVLSRRFGLARGFDRYDDTMAAGGAERASRDTAAAALADIAAVASAGAGPRFLWVHFNDPHAPYAPPEPYRARYAASPYTGEVAAMDEQVGRVIAAFDAAAAHAGARSAVVVAADHGESLGEHGEQEHGHLLYEGAMHVPLAIAGPGVSAAVVDTPVSTRAIFFTVLDWAGLGAAHSLRAARVDADVVLGEAMKPFLEYGWQPQVMAVSGGTKAILSGRVEAYDLTADPAEQHDIAASSAVPDAARNALYDYPVPTPGKDSSATAPLDAQAKQQLASLGYVSGGATPLVRKDAPRTVDMLPTLALLTQASRLFSAGKYAQAIPLYTKILAADAHNIGARLQLASAYSSLGRNAEAVAEFDRAAAVAPDSDDVALYRALHDARGPAWARAIAPLEQVLADAPDRVPALQALARLREKQGRVADAVALQFKVFALQPPPAREWRALGAEAMSAQLTGDAIRAFEQARALDGAAFADDLTLGVLYLADRRFVEAGQSLDRVSASSRDYPMALFKRAQVAVLVHAPDAAARIAAAKAHATPLTRQLIEREKLFQK